MPKKRKSYTMTERAVIRFKKWLVEQNISMTEFAENCGVSKQYISSVVCGRNYITAKCRDIFKKGGYTII